MQQTEYYGRYEGENYQGIGERGQKLSDESDEQFADMLVRRMKGELERERNTFLHARLLLAIVSVIALVMLFGLLVLALFLGVTKGSEGASIGLGWGFIAACWMLGFVNYAFNQNGKQNKNSKSEKKARAGEEETCGC
ncbi:MAG: hypothetical protein M3Y39_03400 [Chloroflexota bacterium]|nr:hypothetical protein [Chloroflexota bacterium]